MRKAAGISAVIAGAIASIIALVGSEPATVLAHERRPRIAALPVAMLAKRSVARDWQPGSEHAYAISLEHRNATKDRGGFELRTTIGGNWIVAVASRDDVGVVIRAELRDARASIKRGDQDLVTGVHAMAMARELAVPHYLHFDPTGRLISLEFSPQQQPAVRGILTAIASSAQVAGAGDSAAWEATESDSLGDYLVRYAPGGSGLTRDKLRYLRGAGGGTVRIGKSHGELAIRDDGWPATVDGTETLELGDERAAAIIDARYRLTHTQSRIGVAVAPPVGLEHVRVDAIASAAKLRENADRELVDGASLDDLLAMLSASTDSNAAGYQYLRLAALFRIDAEAARTAAQRVAADKLPESQTAAVIGALGEAGTETAQQGLGNALATSERSDTRAHAAIALGLTDAPTARTLAALRDAAQTRDELAGVATLALGNAALRVRDDDATAAANTVTALLAQFEHAIDSAERVLVMRALGNTGDVAILRAIEVAIAGTDRGLRIAAVEALRLVRDDRADVLLARALADGDSDVRGAAVFASSERPLAPLLAALRAVAEHDRESDVRRAVIVLAGDRIAEHAELRALLAWSAARDSDGELRALATKALER